MSARWIRSQPMPDYIGDRSRSSGSTLGWAGSEPEKLKRFLAGEDIDNQTAATGRGSLIHMLALGEGAGAFSDFAFYPSQSEATKPEMVPQPGLNKATGKPFKKMIPTGKRIPQDASPAGRNKKMLTNSDDGRLQDRQWREAHRGKTIVYPPDQPIVQAMARTIRNDPHCASLLVGDGYEPEVTGHYVCETGEPVRFRLDGLRLSEDIEIELKSLAPGKFGRLDTSNPNAVLRCAADGFARKSAICHDGFLAITGREATLVWILVEAVEHSPRVSVIYDNHGSTMHEIGRNGYRKAGIKGYLELARMSAAMRETGDFRHPTVVEPQAQWNFPEYIEDAMVELLGMTEVTDG